MQLVLNPTAEFIPRKSLRDFPLDLPVQLFDGVDAAFAPKLHRFQRALLRDVKQRLRHGFIQFVRTGVDRHGELFSVRNGGDLLPKRFEPFIHAPGISQTARNGAFRFGAEHDQRIGKRLAAGLLKKHHARRAARQDHNLRRTASADFHRRAERVFQASDKASAAQRGNRLFHHLADARPANGKFQRQRLVVADRQRSAKRRFRPLFLIKEIAFLEPPCLQFAIAAPGGAFLKDGFQRFLIP